jgi:hypothetical protein
MSRLAGAAVALFLCGACTSCAAGPSREAHRVAREISPELEDAFDGMPALLVVVRPAKLGEDPLYGPLLRRTSQLAAARAVVGPALGQTALAVIERTDEVIVGAYDRDGHDAVVALSGVPADIDPARVMDTNAKPLWIHAQDFPVGVEELAPADGTADAALFVLPHRSWVIAIGAAIVRARTAFIEQKHPRDLALASIPDEQLVVASLRGSALVEARPSLARGPLAPIVRDLDVVSVGLEPGPVGAVGEVVARFVYGDAPFAERASQCVRDVVAAFTDKFEQKAPWLHAVKVSREERAVVVRGRIPRAWADGFLRVDLDGVVQ